jgi:hypothetical protein
MSQLLRSLGTQAGAHCIRPIPITLIAVDSNCVRAPDGLDRSLIGDRPIAGKNFWRGEDGELQKGTAGAIWGGSVEIRHVDSLLEFKALMERSRPSRWWRFRCSSLRASVRLPAL